MPKIMHKGVSYGGGGSGGGDNVNHVKISQAEYDALVAAGKVDSNVVYFIPDGEVDEMLMSNMLVPDYANAQDITSPFTAPCAGYVMITALASRAEGGLIAYVYPTSAKESEVLISSQTYTNSYASSIIPLSKGNHIVFSINDGTIKTAKWVPAKNVVDDDSLALGRTDISGIGDGTITGAIGALNDGASEINSNLGETTQSNEYGIGFARRNNVVSAYGYLSNLPTGDTVNLGAISYKSVTQYSCLNVYSAAVPYPMIGTAWINRTGNLSINKPANTTACFVSGSFVCQ